MVSEIPAEHQPHSAMKDHIVTLRLETCTNYTMEALIESFLSETGLDPESEDIGERFSDWLFENQYWRVWIG
jgi:hypothetical protein